jgi:hypothetical protein
MSDTRTKDGTPEYYRSVTDGDLSQPMELDEFLTGVGVVLRLPPKKEENEAPPPPAAAPAAAATPRSKRGRRSMVVGVCATLSALLIMGMGVQKWDRGYSDTMPPTLLGNWHTESPKYRNRGFTITEKTLQMQRGPNQSDWVTLPIKSVRVRPAQRGRTVELTYDENGAAQTMTLRLEDLDGLSVVSLMNQADILWRRK